MGLEDFPKSIVLKNGAHATLEACLATECDDQLIPAHALANGPDH